MLGSRQREILQLIVDGWELGLDLTLGGNYWIQKGGLGRGGESNRKISSDACQSLRNKGYIAAKYRVFPVQAFELTNAGREALINKEG